jgi:nucleotide-binding universal stress UspA family protein
VLERIVVVVDQSKTAQYAVGASFTLARELGARLHFALTVDPDLVAQDVGFEAMAQMAMQLQERTLRETLARAAAAGVHDATGSVLVDDPATGALAAARERNADSIMIGVAPRVGFLRPFIRSLAERILLETTLPLVAVRRPARGFLSRRIIVPIVDDPLSGVAVEHAVAQALRFQSTLVLCSLIEGDGEAAARLAVARAKAMADLFGVPSEELVLAPDGGVASAIVRNATLQDCDSIVMATHARAGIPRIAEGSVAQAVIFSSDVPVILVRRA